MTIHETTITPIAVNHVFWRGEREESDDVYDVYTVCDTGTGT